MAQDKEPIFWRGTLVGYIKNPQKLPVSWRGKWLPESCKHTKEFLEQLTKGYQVWVEFGSAEQKHMALLGKVPGQEIELNLDMED